MSNDTDQETGAGPESRGTNDEDEAIAAAWRRYLDDPEGGANDLLSALEPAVVRAVKRWGERTLAKCHWPEAAQEVRLKIVPRKFLLRSPTLQLLAPGMGEETEQRKAAVVTTIKNVVYMVAYWASMETAEKVWRYASQHGETELEEVLQEEATDGFDVDARLAQVKASLCEQGYTAAECALFISYVEGLINQNELGEGLGLKQSATSKRIQKLRKKLAARPPADHD